MHCTKQLFYAFTVSCEADYVSTRLKVRGGLKHFQGTIDNLSNIVLRSYARLTLTNR